MSARPAAPQIQAPQTPTNLGGEHPGSPRKPPKGTKWHPDKATQKLFFSSPSTTATPRTPGPQPGTPHRNPNHARNTKKRGKTLKNMDWQTNAFSSDDFSPKHEGRFVQTTAAPASRSRTARPPPAQNKQTTQTHTAPDPPPPAKTLRGKVNAFDLGYGFCIVQNGKTKIK